jgi:hypothetical protein
LLTFQVGVKIEYMRQNGVQLKKTA